MDLQAKLTAEMEGRLTDKETSPTIKSTPFSRVPLSRDNTTYASGNTIIHSSSIASTQVTVTPVNSTGTTVSLSTTASSLNSPVLSSSTPSKPPY